MIKNSFFISIISLGALLIICSSFAPKNNDILLGTKTLYTNKHNNYTPVPNGYAPVFINYVGRHGARFQTSIDDDSLLMVVLRQAEKENGLTREGFKLKIADSLLMAVSDGKVSFISETGKKEQQGIGARMTENFGSVFQVPNAKIKVYTTKKERTKQSAKAFLKGLKPDTLALQLTYNDQDRLAFYDVAPAYKQYKNKGNWKPLFETLEASEKTKAMYSHISRIFLSERFLNKLEHDSVSVTTPDGVLPYNARTFANAVFDIVSIVPSITCEMEQAHIAKEKIDIQPLVSQPYLEWMNFIGSAEDFLVKGPSIDANGIQVKIAAPLLVDFIKTTDTYLATKTTCAQLRFAHAETIAPFAALLGIEGACTPILPDQLLQFDKVWKCENIIPLSANIQWILYSNNKGDLIVKLMLNENEVAIQSLKHIGTPYYYKWSAVRNYYTTILQKLNVSIDDDMHKFLLEVK